MNGVLLINKPLGRSSHDMVYEVRRLTGIKKVGHTGTLDPMAEGVLPVCVGSATKAADMLTATDKAYTAQLILGMTTDTQDATGEVLSECAVNCTEEEIIRAVDSFRGEISQIPPMYSAIKLNGRKLYELARAGETVERKPRTVNIKEIRVTDIDLKSYAVTIDVECSKGTYIRSLCEDIGTRLGVGAYMNTLIRTKSGGFLLNQCRTLFELREQRERIEDLLIPVDELFSGYKKAFLDEAGSGAAVNGAAVSYDGLDEGEIYRVYDYQDRFLCLSRYTDRKLKLVKAFWI